MRFPYWLLITASALTGCGDSGVADRNVRNSAISGREEVKLRLAHGTEDSGDFASAERLFQQVVAQSPRATLPHIELAQFYRRHRADQKAIDSFSAALKIEPDNSEIARDLANTYIGLGDPDKALPLLDRAIAVHPREPLLYNSRGVALDQTGAYKLAQNSYKTAYDLDGGGGMTYKVNISMSYILEGSYDKAIALLRPMLSNPDAPPIIRQNLALAYGMKGENDTALKLGLQDLSNSEAEENVRFYRMLAHKHGTPPGARTVPASVVNDLFPPKQERPLITVVPVNEDEPRHEAKSAPVSPVSVTDEEAASPAFSPSVNYMPVKAEGMNNSPEAIFLPEPVLKPDQR